jgi:sugar phosphate isomerase/epimerase
MPHTTRREFIIGSAAAAAALMLGEFPGLKKKKILLSFSTLGCPDWSLGEVVEFAAKHGFSGLEFRGLKREIDLPKCPEFSTEAAREASRALLQKNKLRFINLGSSATLHFPEGQERDKHLADGKRYIDLAAQLGCPYIRVFPNNFPKGQEKSKTMELIAKGLVELGDYARPRNVMVLMETHGEVVWSADLAEIMRSAAHSHVGLVWDPCNMWVVTKESPADMYSRLKPYIHHTHIKDGNIVNGKIDYKLLGQGEVPVFEAIDLLRAGGYRGYYSFEWEKLWHPELADPEIAFADYSKAMKKKYRA